MRTRGVSERRSMSSTSCRSSRAVCKSTIRPDIFSFMGSKAASRAQKQDAAVKQRHRRGQTSKAPPRESRFAIGLQHDPRGRRPHAGAGEAWQPTKEDVMEVTTDPPGCCWREQQYSAVAISVEATKTMLDWLLPRLGKATGARIVGRGGRGASIILTRKWSRSGAHADHIGTVVYSHLGERKVTHQHTHARPHPPAHGCACTREHRPAASLLRTTCEHRFGSPSPATLTSRCLEPTSGTTRSRSCSSTSATPL